MQLFLVIGEEFSAQDLMFSQAYLRKLKLTLGLDFGCVPIPFSGSLPNPTLFVYGPSQALYHLREVPGVSISPNGSPKQSGLLCDPRLM